MSTTSTVLIIDDDPKCRESLRALLATQKRYKILLAADLKSAATAMHQSSEDLAHGTIDVVVLDWHLNGETGLGFLKQHRDRLDELPVIVLTGQPGASMTIEAMQQGAFHYLAKGGPESEERRWIDLAVRRRRAVLDAKHALNSKLKLNDELLIGASPAILELARAIARVSDSKDPVLILGETGTGKECVARAIHQASPLKDKTFHAVNSAGLTDALADSVLFGHEEGSFTDATKQTNGIFGSAEGAIVFFDEIGELPPTVQAKLLRVLESKEIRRVGGESVRHVDFRIIAATNRDLKAEIARGRFREDLFQRLNTIEIQVPSLRQHKEDIPVLARHFLVCWAQQNQKRVPILSAEAEQDLLKRSWPGNVRELKHAVERGACFAWGNVILPEDLPPAACVADDTENSFDLKEAVKVAERRTIKHALEHTEKNVSAASKLLGIDRTTLYAKLRELGMMSD